MRKFKCWQSNAASPGIPERLKRKARHTENKKQKEKHLQPKLITQRPGHAPFSAQSGQQKKKKKEENPHKQSGRSENAGGDRDGLAKWFKTQLKF